MRYIAIIARLGLAAFGSVACSSEAGGGPGTTAGAAGSFSAGGASGGSPVGGSGGSTAGTGGSALPGGGSSSSGGAPTAVGNWHNVTANLANMASECGNLTMVQAKPGSDMVVAGVAQKGLWATHDGGATWAALGTGAGSAVITNRMSAIVWDPDHPGTFWESGIYNGGGVYKTVDNGVTFTQLGNSFHNDSVSVDLTDPDRKTLLAGGHETPKNYYCRPTLALRGPT